MPSVKVFSMKFGHAQPTNMYVVDLALCKFSFPTDMQ